MSGSNNPEIIKIEYCCGIPDEGGVCCCSPLSVQGFVVPLTKEQIEKELERIILQARHEVQCPGGSIKADGNLRDIIVFKNILNILNNNNNGKI